MLAGPGYLTDTLAEAFSGHCCVSGWLGYANALFVGFGDAPIPRAAADGERTRPPYELETNMADWRVTGGTSAATADDQRDLAERAISTLQGRQVVSWRLGPRHDLTIQFVGGLTLDVVPFSDDDVIDSDAWLVRVPDGRIAAVSCGGLVAQVHEHTPVGRWFE